MSFASGENKLRIAEANDITWAAYTDERYRKRCDNIRNGVLNWWDSLSDDEFFKDVMKRSAGFAIWWDERSPEKQAEQPIHQAYKRWRMLPAHAANTLFWSTANDAEKAERNAANALFSQHGPCFEVKMMKNNPTEKEVRSRSAVSDLSSCASHGLQLTSIL